MKRKHRKQLSALFTLIISILFILDYFHVIPHRISHFWQYDQAGLLLVDTCDDNGIRVPNVTVDVGYGKRHYYAKTNETGQLVEVKAPEIELQHKYEEKYNGRYCKGQAAIPGTEDKLYDRGHVIADSLGGVSNAYNVTAQNYLVNRKGVQNTMEDEMRNTLYNGGTVTNLEVQILYLNNETQIPSEYIFTYEINSEKRQYAFTNSHQ